MNPTAPAASATRPSSRIPLRTLGVSLSAFLMISYVLCVLLGLIWRGGGLHEPWLQFLPGFTWLNWQSFVLGLVETFAYGWYVALVFVPLFNFVAARLR